MMDEEREEMVASLLDQIHALYDPCRVLVMVMHSGQHRVVIGDATVNEALNVLSESLGYPEHEVRAQRGN